MIRILTVGDREAEALPRAGAAAAGFRALEATDEAVAATALQGRLLADLGRVDEARELLKAVREDIPPEAEHARDQMTHLLDSLER